MKGHLIFGILLLGAHFGFCSPNKHPRIINGTLAVPKQFPYQVFYDVLDLTNLQKPIEWESSCGGTLISKRIILTAAHCLNEPDIYAIKIYFGAVDKSNKSEIGQHRLVVKRQNFVIHQEYDTVYHYNDIALIRLPVDVAFDEYIKPAKLPQPGEVYPSEAIVSGWGLVEVIVNGNFVGGDKLKYFDISILPHDECKEWFKHAVPILSSSQICIAPSENMPCKGDSGGPLAVRHEDDFVVLGITSLGHTRYCTINHPSLYTRVVSFLNWIHENAGAHNLDV
ncbi:chymotrypsin-2-like [Drosophila kikkawai]|uniref:Chymotrypsin-2-like n=1 Tax=Drosophila kikkawai TaxID=30033 RepID=A0ABM4GGM8_DROKI